MAKFTKSRMARALANSKLVMTWGPAPHVGERFTLNVRGADTPNGKATYYTLDLTREEMLQVMEWSAPRLAGRKAGPGEGTPFFNRGDVPAALRNLADMIERNAKKD